MSETKTLYGVATNDADYKTQIVSRESGKLELVWVCPIYSRWYAMLQRCYGKSSFNKNATYEGCDVCQEWLIFSNFKEWMERQDWQGKQLDKDLIVAGNRTYGPLTCSFIDPKLNCFVASFSRRNSRFLHGAYPGRVKGTYYSRCKNPFKNKTEHLGVFSSQQGAHDAWRRKKVEQCLIFSRKQDDLKIRRALINLSRRI